MPKWVPYVLMGGIVAAAATGRAGTPDFAASEIETVPWTASFRIGYSPGMASHPELGERWVHGLWRELGLGYCVNPYVCLGAHLSSADMPVDRRSDGKYVRPGADLQIDDEKSSESKTRLPCEPDCIAVLGGREDPGSLRVVVAQAFVEVTPIGPHGPFFGVSGGIGITALKHSYLDPAMTVRGGYRYFLMPNVAVGLTAGLQGLVGDTTPTWTPHLAVDLHLRF